MNTIAARCGREIADRVAPMSAFEATLAIEVLNLRIEEIEARTSGFGTITLTLDPERTLR
jgi:hypothetical protein